MRTLGEIALQLENYAVAPRPDLAEIAKELRQIEEGTDGEVPD